jgi:hypothetical protein
LAVEAAIIFVLSFNSFLLTLSTIFQRWTCCCLFLAHNFLKVFNRCLTRFKRNWQGQN